MIWLLKLQDNFTISTSESENRDNIGATVTDCEIEDSRSSLKNFAEQCPTMFIIRGKFTERSDNIRETCVEHSRNVHRKHLT